MWTAHSSALQLSCWVEEGGGALLICIATPPRTRTPAPPPNPAPAPARFGVFFKRGFKRSPLTVGGFWEHLPLH
jgi:hypothetical protein